MSLTIKETGYLYIYLSYDNRAGGMDVYFDELKITYTESPVAQVNAYYPYGMTALSWVRSGESENKYLYQGKELDGLTGLHDFHARQWDGALGRWFAADPMNQFSSPYLGMGNNPVMGVDPDGRFLRKFFKGTMITAAIEAISTVFNGGLDLSCGSCMSDAWSDFDPTKSGTAVNNAFRIDMGAFKTDSDKDLAGRAWQLAKRNTWQRQNTVAGNYYSHYVNLSGDVERIDYFHGATVVYADGEYGGVSMGGYINLTVDFDRTDADYQLLFNTDYGNELLLHEYGHYLQEQAFGPLTIFSGLNSGLSSRFDLRGPATHGESWTETDANWRALNYFGEKSAFNNATVSRRGSPPVTARENFLNPAFGSNISNYGGNNYSAYLLFPLPIGILWYANH